MRRADVVLCTLLSVHTCGALGHLPEDHIGLTVIDECSQSTEPSCYLGVMRSPKLVLAGDHKQLPPTVLSEEAADLLTSLMERVIAIYGDTVVRMLTVQYRMNTNIMTWSSNAMYDNKLTAHPSVANHLLCHLPNVTETDETKVPLLLIDTSDCPGFEETETAYVNGIPVSKTNEGEATLVLGLIKKLIDAGTGQDQVAVITPYSKQVKLVRNLVSVDFPDVEVQTVDGFQGREKEVIILTLVRSNDKGEIGFLAEDRRLNVAVTRARRQLSVVCNTNTLQQNPFLKSFVYYMMKHAKVVRAEYMDEGYCWIMSHQALINNKLLNEIAALENDSPPVFPPSARDLAYAPILCDHTQCCGNEVDPGKVLSKGDLVRQYQVLFLYVLNPKTYRYRMRNLVNCVWDFSDIDFSIVSNIFNHFCSHSVNSEYIGFDDNNVKALVLKRLHEYSEQQSKPYNECWKSESDEKFNDHGDDSPEPRDTRSISPQSRGNRNRSDHHYRMDGENRREKISRSNRHDPYGRTQQGESRHRKHDRQPLMETTAF